jgi:hypothetical protein
MMFLDGFILFHSLSCVVVSLCRVVDVLMDFHSLSCVYVFGFVLGVTWPLLYVLSGRFA